MSDDAKYTSRYWVPTRTLDGSIWRAVASAAAQQMTLPTIAPTAPAGPAPQAAQEEMFENVPLRVLRDFNQQSKGFWAPEPWDKWYAHAGWRFQNSTLRNAYGQRKLSPWFFESNDPVAKHESPNKCECGSFKASGTQRGAIGHSSWCPWSEA